MGRFFRLALLSALTLGAGALAYERGGFAAWFLFWLLGGMLAVSIGILFFTFLRVRVNRALAADVIAAGDILRAELHIHHLSLLPVLWLSVSDRWVRQADGESFTVTKLVFPGWRRRFKVRYEVAGLKRGLYRYEGTELLSGDLWGMAVKRRVIRSDGAFTVMPEARPLLGGAVPRGLGSEEPAVNFRYGSPIAGHTVREYVQGDPMHRIHWKSTARMGELMTRATDPAEELRVMVYVDAEAGAYKSPAGAELFEQGVGWAAGLLHDMTVNRAEAGLAANNRGELWLPPSARPDFARMNRLLAELQPDGGLTMKELLLSKAESLIPGGFTFVVVTPSLRESTVEALLELRARKRSVLLCYLQGTGVPSVAVRECKRRLERAGCVLVTIKEPYREKEVRLHAESEGA